MFVHVCMVREVMVCEICVNGGVVGCTNDGKIQQAGGEDKSGHIDWGLF